MTQKEEMCTHVKTSVFPHIDQSGRVIFYCVPLFKKNLGTQLLDKETLQLKIVGLDGELMCAGKKFVMESKYWGAAQ